MPGDARTDRARTDETAARWDRQTSIRRALERLETRIDGNPGFGRGTHTSVSTIGPGVRCRTSDGRWEISTDMPVAMGGSNTAPSPSVLAWAALGSCLAMGYAMRAARHGVAVSSIEVTVESDSALDGMLVTGSASPAGFEQLRCHVDVAGAATAEEITAILDEADRLSPVLDMFQRVNPVRRTVTIRSTEA